MSQETLRIADDFSATPGSRYESEGEFSGEEFRRTVLLPRLRESLASGDKLLVDLDGTAGYGTSFLEEAFGGLVRDEGIDSERLREVLLFKSNEEEYLIDDIWAYIDDAQRSAE